MSKFCHELLGYECLKIIQDEENFRFSLDSLLLAHFIDTTKAKKIIDLCCGNAPIPLFLSLKTDALITGVEIQEASYKLGLESVILNNLESQITLINDDLKGIYKKLIPNSFDICCFNPPYFKKDSSLKNINESYSISRHEVKVTLEEIISESVKLLKDGGFLYLISKSSRLSEVILLLEKHKFGIKKIKFVYPKKDKVSNVFLLEARKNKVSEVKICKPLYIYADSTYTKEVLEIFNFKKNK